MDYDYDDDGLMSSCLIYGPLKIYKWGSTITQSELIVTSRRKTRVELNNFIPHRIHMMPLVIMMRYNEV